MASAAPEALLLHLGASWVVGNGPDDVGLAAAVGAWAIYLGTDQISGRRVWSLPSFAAAADFSLERVVS
jgi:hypothetical protein